MIKKRKSVDPKSAISFKIFPDNKIVRASHETTILQALLDAGIPMDSTCGGMGTCGTCRVFVDLGIEKLGPRNDIEREFAEERSFHANERLTCQCLVQEDIVIRRPRRSN